MLVSPGAAPFPVRPGPLDGDAAAASAARSCAGRARGAVTRLARTLEPDAIIERYYNFGGEGILAGAALGEADDARGQRAGDRLPGLDARRGSIGCCSSSRCGAGASGICRARRA